ncbi:Uncharacterized damage-inducible protein DinB (forms a four-helix bundle) [Marivirga sericea]|uniref:Uncharacterized damage-inducible protein DinB (Forms a four-helix bundle) n=1 Tax=Marivirga sericea TaxID=1028 RepID=A0A1X7J3B3_9BACT|nr:DinB family protein [Marivirga sericea]SMG21976.1 Uncharacterized damage-inducible protein DinB (forms a four-helix bundle) [Marivirga sericea]
MLSTHIDYANYNIWANKRIVQCLLKLDEKLLEEPIISSFPNIKATLAHLWMAELGWLSRLKGDGWDTSQVKDFYGSTAGLMKEWKKTSEQFKDFVEKADLEQELKFEHKGEKFSIPFKEIAHTVFNHGTYHRGQVVMMLRQLGINEIPQTDYIEWVREKARAKNA